MRRQKRREELIEEIRRNIPDSAHRGRTNYILDHGDMNSIKDLANKYNIPLERDATPRPTRGEPIRTWEETGPVKTLEDANHVLKAKNINDATTLQQGLNDIKRYHLPNEITKVHTEYGPNDIDIKPIPVKLPERTSRSAQQSPISNTGGGAERDIPRNRDESPASANVRIAMKNASEGKNDPRFNEALSKTSAQQRLRASTAIPKHKYEEDIPARSYRGMENSEEPAEIGNVNVYRSVKEDKSKEKSAIDDIFNKQGNLDIDSDVLQTEHGPKFYQKLLRGTYKQAAKAYGGDPFVYQGSAFVNPSELETIARGRVQEISPFSRQEEERNQALNDIILSYANDQTAQESIKPYLAELSKNPARHHKELMGDVESNMEDTITNRANRNFLEKVLPTIRSKYQTPGLLQHGHMGKDIGEAVEKHGRGVAEELSKAKLGMRNITLNASQRHAQQQGEAAGISQQAAIKDRQNNLDAINALQIADKQRKAEKGAYVGNLERLGKQDTDLAQRHRNYEIELAHRIHEHPKTQVEGMASVLKGVPQPYKATGITGKGPARPETTEGQLWTGAGNMLAGAGAYMMPRPAKKGGRIHKAVGGQVDPMQDVIQNAVIDRRDPVTELRQMIQHARGVQALQGRQQLKIGGSVDPIQAGATDANLYAGHSSMKNKLERLRRPQEGKSPAGFMSAMAAASKDTKGWLGDIMRAYGSADEQINKEKSEHRNRINSADDLEYALQEKLKDRAQKEREMAAKDKMDAANIAHLQAQSKKLEHDMGVVNGISTQDPNDLPTGKQKPKEIENVNLAQERSRTAAKLLENMNEIEKISGTKENPGVETGYWTNKALNVLGPGITSILMGGDKKDYVNLRNLFNEHVELTRALDALKGQGRQSNLQTGLLIASKPSEELERDQLIDKLTRKKKQIALLLKGTSHDIKTNKGSINDINYPLQFMEDSSIETESPKKNISTTPQNINEEKRKQEIALRKAEIKQQLGRG